MMSKTDRILEFLRDQVPFSPTLREIQDACGFSSVSLVAYHLNKLEDKGLISRSGPNQARSIRVASAQPLVKITLPWIPVEEVRGNSRLAPKYKASATKMMRQSGIDNGVVYMLENPDREFPIAGDLTLEVDMWTEHHIDFDNALIGLKGVIDGFGQGTKRHSGAGLIIDDRQIKTATIRLHSGEPNTVITLRQCVEDL